MHACLKLLFFLCIKMIVAQRLQVVDALSCHFPQSLFMNCHPCLNSGAEQKELPDAVSKPSKYIYR